MSEVLDAQVTAFRNRPLEGQPYAFAWVDALTQKIREGGRIVNVEVLGPPVSTPTGTARSSASRPPRP